MKTYYIYHIPGIKIGCTVNPEKRIKHSQGYHEWEILETHTDGWLAGDRELELQKEYGYTVDTSHYMTTVANSGLTKEACRLGGITTGFTKEQMSKGGKAQKGKPKPSHIGLNFQKQKQCQYCMKTVNAGNFSRWHGDNCKLNNTYNT